MTGFPCTVMMHPRIQRSAAPDPTGRINTQVLSSSRTFCQPAHGLFRMQDSQVSARLVCRDMTCSYSPRQTRGRHPLEGKVGHTREAGYRVTNIPPSIRSSRLNAPPGKTLPRTGLPAQKGIGTTAPWILLHHLATSRGLIRKPRIEPQIQNMGCCGEGGADCGGEGFIGRTSGIPAYADPLEEELEELDIT